MRIIRSEVLNLRLFGGREGMSRASWVMKGRKEGWQNISLPRQEVAKQETGKVLLGENARKERKQMLTACSKFQTLSYIRDLIGKTILWERHHYFHFIDVESEDSALFLSSIPLLHRGVKCFEILEEKSQFLSFKNFISLGSQLEGTEKRKHSWYAWASETT